MSDSMFTRRHYKRIASVIWHILPETGGEKNCGKCRPLISRNLLIDDLCRTFARDNYLFDEDKFRSAVDGDKDPDA